MNAPIKVAVTGAAGNIGYALLFRIASGDCDDGERALSRVWPDVGGGMDTRFSGDDGAGHRMKENMIVPASTPNNNFATRRKNRWPRDR